MNRQVHGARVERGGERAVALALRAMTDGAVILVNLPAGGQVFRRCRDRAADEAQRLGHEQVGGRRTGRGRHDRRILPDDDEAEQRDAERAQQRHTPLARLQATDEQARRADGECGEDEP